MYGGLLANSQVNVINHSNIGVEIYLHLFLSLLLFGEIIKNKKNLSLLHLWRVNFLLCGVRRRESVREIIKMMTTVSVLWRRRK